MRLILLFAGLLFAGMSAHAQAFTVTTTADAGAGSLREAILQANGTAGPNDIEFNIPTTDAGYNGTWWTITLATELPLIEDDGTRLLGSTQTANAGDTNAGMLGSGVTVGVDQEPLPMVERPEVAINGNGGGFDVITLTGGVSDIEIEGLAIYGGEVGVHSLELAFEAESGDNRVLRGLVIGLLPDGADPGVLRNASHGVELLSSERREGGVTGATTRLTVENCFVGLNGNVGITGDTGATSIIVRYNEVFGNGWASEAHDGIDANGIGNIVEFNLSRDNTNAANQPNESSGHGIELGTQLVDGTGGSLIRNNTVVNNLGAGIAARNGAANNVIEKNIIRGNAVGVSINNEVRLLTRGNTITQNEISGNDGLGIDIHAPGNDNVAFDGLTLNSSSLLAINTANGLAPYPVLTLANIENGSVTVEGFSAPGAVVEVFLAEGDEFGEGARFIGAGTEGTSDDENDASGSYGPDFGTITVSTVVVNAERFRFVLPLTNVSVPAGAQFTATSTIDNNTSEFGPNVEATGAVSNEADVPAGFTLHDAYPNPFNPSTTLSFDLDQPRDVTLTVYDLTGREVARLLDGGTRTAGTHRVRFDAAGLSSGVYVYRLEADGFGLSRRVVLTK
ncbi:MAG: T9SS type A sorting domain-containing protein [Bacteroidota bacterium]